MGTVENWGCKGVAGEFFLEVLLLLLQGLLLLLVL